MNYDNIPPVMHSLVARTIEYMKARPERGFKAGYDYLQTPHVMEEVRSHLIPVGYDGYWRNPFTRNGWVDSTLMVIFYVICVLFVLTIGVPFFSIFFLISGIAALYHAITGGKLILEAATAKATQELMEHIGESLYANRDEVEAYGRDVVLAKYHKLIK